MGNTNSIMDELNTIQESPQPPTIQVNTIQVPNTDNTVNDTMPSIPTMGTMPPSTVTASDDIPHSMSSPNVGSQAIVPNTEYTAENGIKLELEPAGYPREFQGEVTLIKSNDDDTLYNLSIINGICCVDITHCDYKTFDIDHDIDIEFRYNEGADGWGNAIVVCRDKALYGPKWRDYEYDNNINAEDTCFPFNEQLRFDRDDNRSNDERKIKLKIPKLSGIQCITIYLSKSNIKLFNLSFSNNMKFAKTKYIETYNTSIKPIVEKDIEEQKKYLIIFKEAADADDFWAARIPPNLEWKEDVTDIQFDGNPISNSESFDGEFVEKIYNNLPFPYLLAVIQKQEEFGYNKREELLSEIYKLSKDPVCNTNMREGRYLGRGDGKIHDIIDPSNNLCDNQLLINNNIWIPSVFHCDKKECVIKSEILNLDIYRYGKLYQLLSDLFYKMLPGFNQICGRNLIAHDLKVIVKIQDYLLKPGDVYFGNKHIEGTENENIVAVGLYYPEINENIKCGELELSTMVRAGCGNKYLKSKYVGIEQGDCIIFSNETFHKVELIKCDGNDDNNNNDIGHRKIIGFFICWNDKIKTSMNYIINYRSKIGFILKNWMKWKKENENQNYEWMMSIIYTFLCGDDQYRGIMRRNFMNKRRNGITDPISQERTGMMD